MPCLNGLHQRTEDAPDVTLEDIQKVLAALDKVVWREGTFSLTSEKLLTTIADSDRDIKHDSSPSPPCTSSQPDPPHLAASHTSLHEITSTIDTPRAPEIPAPRSSIPGSIQAPSVAQPSSAHAPLVASVSSSTCDSNGKTHSTPNPNLSTATASMDTVGKAVVDGTASDDTRTSNTRMTSVHPSDPPHPLACTGLLGSRSCFVPTSLSLGMRPTKQSLSLSSMYSRSAVALRETGSSWLSHRSPSAATPVMQSNSVSPVAEAKVTTSVADEARPLCCVRSLPFFRSSDSPSPPTVETATLSSPIVHAPTACATDTSTAPSAVPAEMPQSVTGSVVEGELPSATIPSAEASPNQQQPAKALEQTLSLSPPLRSADTAAICNGAVPSPPTLKACVADAFPSSVPSGGRIACPAPSRKEASAFISVAKMERFY
ncbi:hypothetical protein, conserved [Leishmania lindenbergi]|uniref:Uncharacterized protein n=1 Tax=Leishmania lindenbergi TaxID=651832 RepID=A0AAW3A478_9TRYP